MKKTLLAIAVVMIGASFASAGEKPTPGTITSMTSVACGSKKQGKKEQTDLMCQQYTIRTATSEYQVRQQKPSNSEIIPVNTPVEFTMDKDKMKFKANGKSYTYLVVGNTALGAGTQ